jgi:hypothetical protein
MEKIYFFYGVVALAQWSVLTSSLSYYELNVITILLDLLFFDL